MFRPTDRQTSLWNVATQLPESTQQRLRGSWAEGFQAKVLPVLLREEDAFAGAYNDGVGRPNWSIARMLGVLFLQDINGLVDQAALDCVAFDARWQHALGLLAEDAYLSRRSLVDFRARLVKLDPQMKLLTRLFECIGEAAIDDLQLSIGKQRIDSTLITSNIRTKGRVDLFRKTLKHFLTGLSQRWPDRLEQLNAELRAWHEEDSEGWFGRGQEGRDKARKLLVTLAGWLHEVHAVFADDDAIKSDERYQLVGRLLSEHCEIVEGESGAGGKTAVVSESSNKATDKPPVTPTTEESPTETTSPAADEPSTETAAPAADEPSTKIAAPTPGESPAETPPPAADEPSTKIAAPTPGESPAETTAPAADQSSTATAAPTGEASSEAPAQIRLRKTMEAPGTSMQSPFDPDAGYGKKGPGYLVHITETCGNEGPEIITDFEVVGSGCSDSGKTTGALERLDAAGRKPEVMYADGGYPTGESILEAEAMGVKLHAPSNLGRLPQDTVGRDQFEFDEESGEVLTCPAGHAPRRHAQRSTHSSRPPSLHAYFDGNHCRACPLKGRCVARPPNNGKNGQFHLEVTANLRARDDAVAEQENEQWWEDYSIRSGIEATNSELKRAHGFGRLRVRRRARVTLAVACKLTACNIKRWLRAAGSRHSGSPNLPGRLLTARAAVGQFMRRFVLSWLNPLPVVA